MGSKRKIIFICRERSEYGCDVGAYSCASFGLVNSARFVSAYLNAHHLAEAHVVTADDANDVDRLVTKYDPDVVVVEALWVTPSKMRELIALHGRRTWIVRVHSGLPFLASEGQAMEWLLEYRGLPSFFVAPNTMELARDLVILGVRAAYLPNIYWHSRAESAAPLARRDDGVVRVGCFGAIRPLKNHLAQAVAALGFAEEIGRELRFHVNDRLEQGGQHVVKNLRALLGERLVEHAWLEHGDFLELVRSTDVGMQVSLSETFNIVAADFAFCGVPIVASPQVSWLPEICRADPSSTASMRHGLLRVWRDATGAARQARAALDATVRSAAEAWSWLKS